MSTHHEHGHNHSHTVSEDNLTRRFYLGIILNMIYVVVEVIYGFITNSMALIADAGHNISDVLSLVLGLLAVYLVRKKPSDTFTYGLGRSSILISLTNGILLILAVGAIAWETIKRFGEPVEVPGITIIIVASIGVVINTLSTLLFLKGKADDLNIRAAFMHLALDALVSLGVVIGGIVIYYTGWYIVDSIISIAIIIVIVFSTISLLLDALKLSLDAVPNNIQLHDIKEYLQNISGVETFHDLHVWAMSTTKNALTVHLVLSEQANSKKSVNIDELLSKTQDQLKIQFHIEHSTIQIEGVNLHCGCS